MEDKNKSAQSPGSVPQEEVRFREETFDVRGGARQEDQLETLNP